MSTAISRKRRVLLVALLATVTGAACRGDGPSAPGFGNGNTRVLFMGNSLTYTNDLPSMVVALARQAGDERLRAASVAYANYALEDHWLDGTAERALAEHRWEYVVMQQGSSALPASQVNLRTWTMNWAPKIRAAGAEPVLFMVWPTSNVLGNFPYVLQSYRNAAGAVDGIFAPAGDAWVAYGDVGALYSSDGLHPSAFGTYLAALVLLERLTGIDPMRLPPQIPGVPATEGEVRALQQAARVALDRNSARPRME